MRRSESFHQVARRELCSSRGGSDSGLFYCTEYDLEPRLSATKSLDRIDESLGDVVARQKRTPKLLGGPLRSDELYDESRFKVRQGRHLPEEKTTMFVSGKGEFERFARTGEAGIFGGRPCDAFGLGKNRFNAGKYSGSRLPREGHAEAKTVVPKRGKVTDVISGLY